MLDWSERIFRSERMPLRVDRFLRACRLEPVDKVPVWFMRQAGRYQPEYRKLRERYSLNEICRHPDAAAEVTLLPVNQLGVDAAILFSDIMVPVQAVGIPVDLKPNVGPVLDEPLRDSVAVSALRALHPEEDVPFVLETIRILRKELDVPLIGFAGGPFTVASYLIEGRPTRKFSETKRMMYRAPELWRDLMERLVAVIVPYLRAQVAAGAQAIQLFDSWIGALSPEDYREYVFPYSRRIFTALEGLGVPRIHFGVGTGELLTLMRDAGAEVVGADWLVPIDKAAERIGAGVALQGNLEPNLLLGPDDLVSKRAGEILRRVGGRRGYIFNLGHGVLPDTRVDTLRRLVDQVHGFEPSRS